MSTRQSIINNSVTYTLHVPVNMDLYLLFPFQPTLQMTDQIYTKSNDSEWLYDCRNSCASHFIEVGESKYITNDNKNTKTGSSGLLDNTHSVTVSTDTGDLNGVNIHSGNTNK